MLYFSAFSYIFMFCLTELGGLRYDMKRKSFAKSNILAQALANMESGIGLLACASRAAWLVCATPFLGFGIRPPSSEQLSHVGTFLGSIHVGTFFGAGRPRTLVPVSGQVGLQSPANAQTRTNAFDLLKKAPEIVPIR